MLLNSLLRRARLMGLAGMVVAALALAACGGGAADSETEPPADSNQAVAEAPTEAPPTEEAAEQPADPTEEAAQAADDENLLDSSQSLPEQAAGPVTCEAINIPENMAIAEVTDEDWSRGPADAPVTMIEYGDFQ